MTHGDPLVSVVIIFHDEEQFLAEAVESVLGQTYDAWHLVLVDDGSTDASTGIARRYAKAYPDRIEYRQHAGHRQLGTGASRQAGLEQSRGDYLAFLDGDDVWERHKLARQVQLLEGQPELAMTYGQTLVWYSWCTQAGQPPDYVKPLGVMPGRTIREPDLLTVFLGDEFTCPGCGSVLMRSDAVRGVGGFETEFAGQYEDMILYAKLLLRYPAWVEEVIYSRYRQHEGNSWVDDRRQSRWHPEWHTPSRGRYLRWVAAHLRNHPGQVTPELDRTLTAALRPYEHPVRFMASRAYHLGRFYLRRALHSLSGSQA